jgi:hypothetical protein
MKKAKGIRFFVDSISNTGKILNTITLDLLELSESGVLIYQMIDQEYSYHDILQELIATYSDIHLDKLKEDLDNFLTQLVTCGILER